MAVFYDGPMAEPPNEPDEPDEPEEPDEPPTAGDYNVVLGPPPPGSIGSGNVYVRDADARGNVMHNGPEAEAIGFGAQAGPGGKSIGAFSGATGETELIPLLRDLVAALQTAGDGDGAAAATDLVRQVQSRQPNAGAIARAWEIANGAATLNGLTTLALRIEPLIHALLH